MWVCPAGSHKYGAYATILCQVIGESLTHGRMCMACQRQVVGSGRRGDKGLDGEERVARRDVDCGKVVGEGWVCGKEGEV